MKTVIKSAICFALVLSSNALAQDVVTYVDPGNQGATQQPQPLVQTQPTQQGQQGQPASQGQVISQGQTYIPGQPYYPGQTYYPGMIVQQPYYPQYPQPVIQPWPGSGSFTPGYVPPVYYPSAPDPNPVVGYVPNTVTSITYDIYGNPIVSSQSQTVMQSATGPLRNTAVAGTTRNVNRYELDQYGRQVHVTGTEWLGADGIWHGNLNRQTVTVGQNGVIQNQNDIINYSQNETKKASGNPPKKDQ